MQKRILSVNNNISHFSIIYFSVLGKLSSTQIKAGYAALKEIEAFIKANNFNTAFVEANNTYYTRSTYPLILHVMNKYTFLF